MASSMGYSLLFLTIFISATTTTTALIFPIRKDPKTSQLFTTFQMGSHRATINTVIDLGGRNLWLDCDNYNSTSYAPLDCDSAKCPNLGCFGCNGPTRPGCSDNTCAGRNSINPFLADFSNRGYYEDTLSTGKASAAVELPQFMFSCVENYFRGGLATGTAGISGLGMSAFSIHKQAADILNSSDKFWFCPASSGLGKLSIGSIPTGSEISHLLKSTKLIINPNSTALDFIHGDASEDYFIGVKSIRVAGEALSVNDSYFSIDRNGVGGTKLSTVQNYTSLHTSIYKPLARAFDKAAANLKIRSAAAVSPFTACYRSESISRTATGPAVPAIDLVLAETDVYWRINGANLMVDIDWETMCLAFVDAGSRPRTSIVIGVHQLVDNLLEFDVDSLQLKFSSSLLVQNKTCSRL